ncbi:hypothetical protein ACFQEX_16855 [Roseibium salinum]|uniref:hypothetical protein n=1 Tax=Roseibium salinum TaxID=1604349 RepID=UPI003608DF6D
MGFKRSNTDTILCRRKLRRNRGSHYRLYDTLNAWADLASGGQNARVTLALNEATKPFLSEDTFGQERLLWALRDEDGKAAEALASVETRDQTASVDWLQFFAKNGLLDQVYSPEEFQLLTARRQRDAAKGLEQSYLGSVTNGRGTSHLKPVSASLVKWMQWHLDTVELVDWILENGAVPHPGFSWEYGRPQNKVLRPALSPEQKRLWGILTSDAYAQTQLPTNHWFDLRENLDLRNPSDALEFLSHVAPKLIIRPSTYRKFEEHTESLFGQFTFELKLRNPEIDFQVDQIVATPARQHGLENLCEQLSQLVLTGLEWLSLVDKASSENDLTGYSIPSISPHSQNQFVDEFGQLVFLLRTAFDRRLASDVDSAVSIAVYWAQQKYPLFKRLFLYAANKSGSSLDRWALNVLIEDDAKWLWALDTTHEVKVYLRERVKHWQNKEVSRLCRAIIKGPNRKQYRHMPNREWRELRDHMIIMYLSKLEQGNVTLPPAVADRFSALKHKCPYTPPADQSDEFLVFSEPSRDLDWGTRTEQSKLIEFAQITPAKRVQQWTSDQSRILRELAESDPKGALETLEEGIEQNLEDEEFWSEGISGLTHAIELAILSSDEGSENG